MHGIYWTEAGRRQVRNEYRALLDRSSLKLSEQRFPTCEGESCAIVTGSEDAPPLVLFHGGNTNSLMWLRSMATWGTHFRVYSVDTIGDPGFSAESRPSFSTDRHAEWLDDVWRSLSLTSAAIVGASLGGWLALDYAIRRPGRVRSLALLAPAGIVRMNGVSALRISMLMLMGSWGRRQGLLQMFGFSERSLTDEDESFLKFCNSVQKRILSRLRLPSVISDEQLRSLSMPVLAAIGGQDILFDGTAVRRRFETCLPQSKIHFLADRGHGLTDLTESVFEFLIHSYSPSPAG
jgi:pimeloyl-ACP methyl ester carboxylesterase